MTEVQMEMITRLRKSGMGYTEVARATGIPKDTVKSFCQRNNLGGRTKEAAGMACPQCGKELDRNAKTRKPRFCCESCRRAWWRAHPEMGLKKAVYEFTCAYCGKPFFRPSLTQSLFQSEIFGSPVTILHNFSVYGILLGIL